MVTRAVYQIISFSVNLLEHSAGLEVLRGCTWAQKNSGNETYRSSDKSWWICIYAFSIFYELIMKACGGGGGRGLRHKADLFVWFCNNNSSLFFLQYFTHCSLCSRDNTHLAPVLVVGVVGVAYSVNQAKVYSMISWFAQLENKISTSFSWSPNFFFSPKIICVAQEVN